MSRDNTLEPEQTPRPMATEPRIGEELKKMEQDYEPLLPVEKKLIAWSLVIGLTLLVVLYFVSKLLPDSHRPL
jgi:hypothetical protein